LWDVLASAYQRLGFAAVGDETFKRLVLARIIEPTSEADTIRVLDEIGVAAPALRTIFRSLDRCVDRDYRDVISKACVARCAAGGPAVMVMYDVTTSRCRPSRARRPRSARRLVRSRTGS